ncbi:MAG: helix-turn-helix domain-containing protein [Pseudomonadales bacterium]
MEPRYPNHVPVNYLRVLLEFLKKQDCLIEPAAVRRIEQLQTEALDGFISVAQFVEAHTSLVSGVDDPVIGLKFGEYLSNSDHGVLGALTGVCSTVPEVLEMQARYLETRTATRVKLCLDGDRYISYFDYAPAYEPIFKFHNHVIAAGFIGILKERVGYVTSDIEVGFPFEQEMDYQSFLPYRIRFNQKRTYVSIPKAYAEIPLLRGDEVTKQLFVKTCNDIRDKVRRNITIGNSIDQLLSTYDGYPSIVHVAEMFHMTPRTLTNKLAKESTSFRKLLLNHRINTAKKYLVETDLTIEKITEKAGYSNIGNFCRAFKRETGLSPSDYRLRNSV